MAPRASWLVPVVIFLAACSGSDTSDGGAGTDAGTDVTAVDTGPGIGMDAGMDVGMDTGVDTGVDVCPDALADGNCLVCGPGQRACDGACVDPTDPAHGCADPSCTPCTFAHATATCGDAGRCTMGACAMGYTDCNGDPLDGCETATGMDPAHCGGCGTACLVPHATAACAMGRCTVGACSPGYGDCNGMSADGCELPTTADVNNCGACGNHCALPNATASGCAMGACTVITCAAGFGDCNAMAADGCEASLQTDAANCGGCGHGCTVPHATAACHAGACAVGACDADFGDCDGNPANGCETDLRVTPTSCGRCGTACTYANATGVCAMSACAMGPCNAGYTDCDSDPTNGCEVHTAADANNCGACMRVCNVPNARAGCAANRCTVAACDGAFADCNHDPTDGCEVNTGDSVPNCGGCGRVCVTAHATPTCGEGVCQIAACSPGFQDCNMAPGDGCEVSINTDPDHCGGCGTVCNFPHAARSCVAGVCTLGLCDPGFADCDGDPTTGCEVRLSLDNMNCGRCGIACDTASQFCSAGACVGR